MAPTRPCARHSLHRWMAYCDDCTAWHLAQAIALRDDPALARRPRASALGAHRAA